MQFFFISENAGYRNLTSINLFLIIIQIKYSIIDYHIISEGLIATETTTRPRWVLTAVRETHEPRGRRQHIANRAARELDAYRYMVYVPRLRAVYYKYSLTVIIMIVIIIIVYRLSGAADLELLSDVTVHRVCAFRRRRKPIITAALYYILLHLFFLKFFYLFLFGFTCRSSCRVRAQYRTSTGEKSRYSVQLKTCCAAEDYNM